MFDILTGKVNPSGKLSETYPLKLEDTPSRNNFPGTLLSVEYRESIFIGYRYYDKTEKEVLKLAAIGEQYSIHPLAKKITSSPRYFFYPLAFRLIAL